MHGSQSKTDSPNINSPAKGDERRGALIAVCLGSLLVALDGTSVLTALPNIATDLHLSQTDLGWVVSAFLLTYSSLRLLSGHLSDLYGHRALFLKSLILFTAASLAGGVATFRELLIAARAVQGAAGALIVTSAFSLIVELSTDGERRAKAIATYGFTTSGSGAVGVLLGGVLTGAWGWRWVFLINLPIGVATYVASHLFLPRRAPIGRKHPIDLLGSIIVTASLVLASYALLERNRLNGQNSHTALLLLSATILFGVFVKIEARTQTPLVPLKIFQNRNLLVCCATNVLFSASGVAAVFASLYLQLVRHYDPFSAGISFLPLGLSTALFSLGPAPKLVALCDIRWPIAGGLLLMATGLIYLGGAPISGSINTTILPGLILMGVGTGMFLSPLLIGAMKGVARHDVGIASGIIGTTSAIGRALGLALLVDIATTRTEQLTAAGYSSPVALNSGYHTAFFLAAGLAIVAATFCIISLRLD